MFSNPITEGLLVLKWFAIWSSVFPRIRYWIVFGVLLSKLNSLYKLSSVFQNAPEVSMDLIVQIFVIHATLLCVNDVKAIVHMNVLKATQDTSVFPQGFEI